MKKNTRKPISKKARFEIFKRDKFKCQYCGNTPPNVVLECDHIIPVSKGGKNNPENLITSCFDCNRGKSDRLLESVPESLESKINEVNEKSEQLKAYERSLKSINRQSKKNIKMVCDVFNMYHEGYMPKERFQQGSIKKFNDELDVYTVMDAMHSACGRKSNPEDALRYFCGICWNKIKGNERW